MMVQLVCLCLNIRIHAKGDVLHELDISELHLAPVEASDKFFQHEIAKIVWDLGGLTKSQHNICKTRDVGKWQVTSCCSCGMDTHAIHTSGADNLVLVNLQLEHDQNKIQLLMEQQNYSPLFKVLLPFTSGPVAENSCGFECAVQSSRLESAILAVHQQIASYLHNEQQAMEERIRSYVSQQKSEYLALQNKVHQDKQSMLSLLLKLQEEDVNEQVKKALVENPNLFMPPSPPIREVAESSSSSESTSTKAEQADLVPRTVVHVAKTTTPVHSRSKTFGKPIPRRRYLRRSASQQLRMAQTADALGIFNMEGIVSGDECAPFCTSDDGSTDESSAAEDVAVNSRRQYQRYTASLPINVPTWHSAANHSSGSDEEQEVPPLDDPVQVAASIKALSLSVKEDGTEMFGDLPPSQLTTADLLNSHLLLNGQE